VGVVGGRNDPDHLAWGPCAAGISARHRHASHTRRNLTAPAAVRRRAVCLVRGLGSPDIAASTTPPLLCRTRSEQQGIATTAWPPCPAVCGWVPSTIQCSLCARHHHGSSEHVLGRLIVCLRLVTLTYSLVQTHKTAMASVAHPPPPSSNTARATCTSVLRWWAPTTTAEAHAARLCTDGGDGNRPEDRTMRCVRPHMHCCAPRRSTQDRHVSRMHPARRVAEVCGSLPPAAGAAPLPP
jgi:hypothetical protein